MKLTYVNITYAIGTHASTKALSKTIMKKECDLDARYGFAAGTWL